MVLYLSGKHWDDDFGGNTVFTDGEEVFADLSPEENSVCLVLAAQPVMSFCKFLNHTTPGPIFDLQSFYYEKEL